MDEKTGSARLSNLPKDTELSLGRNRDIWNALEGPPFLQSSGTRGVPSSRCSRLEQPLVRLRSCIRRMQGGSRTSCPSLLLRAASLHRPRDRQDHLPAPSAMVMTDATDSLEEEHSSVLP